MSLNEELHGRARVQVALGKMDGYKFDKRITRFNDIVETAVRYGRCGQEFNYWVVRPALIEAIETCSPDIPEMYSAEGPLGLVPDWMMVANSP